MNGTEVHRKRETTSPIPGGGAAASSGGASGDRAAGGPPPIKKARFAPPPSPSASASPMGVSTAGDDNGDEEEMDVEVDQALENFRKEAIYREMQEYRRKYERASDTIDQLERDRRTVEARLAAVDLSWNLLVREAELLLPSTSTSNGHSHASTAISSNITTSEELETALAARSSATLSLLRKLEALHPSDQSEKKVEELTQGCRRLLDESLRSQEAHRLLLSRHESTLAQLQSTVAQLERAEKKLDRLKSRTVAVVEGRAFSNVLSSAAAAAGGGGSGSSSPMERGESGDVKPNGTRRPSATGATNGLPSDSDEYRALAESRAKEIEELRNERASLKLDFDSLKARLTSLREEDIMESGPYKFLQNHLRDLTKDLEAKHAAWEVAASEAEKLREIQAEFRSTVFAEAEEQVDEVQKRLLARESDLTRIRAQREEFKAEATELRAKDGEKVKNLDQLKTLAQSREDRIAAYASEVRRLKMQIAALKGDSQTVDLYATHAEEDIIADLQSRLKTAESLLLALRDQLQAYAKSHSTSSSSGDASTITRSETEARLDLAKCRERLAKLETLLGPEGNVEVADLAAKLEAREERLKVLEAQNRSQEQETDMLYGEIDRLSTAWSTLDEQNNAKVFSLVHLEEKVQRINTERAKADNRYFATMRQKESLAAENVVLTKLAEKQQRAVEAANDLQHSLGTQLTAAEREISSHQRSVRLHQEALASVKRENQELTMRNEMTGKQVVDLSASLEQRIQQLEQEQDARKRMEEQVSKADRQLKAARLAAATASSSSSANSGEGASAQVRELQSYNDDLSAMLKCSTCKIRFKAVIINRCGHLFCKDCIDARLSNRQRKCPTCGIAFGKDDVSPVYF